MTKNKEIYGLFAGLFIAVILWFIPLDGISGQGQHCLAVSVLAIVWWATNVIDPGYTSAMLLGSYVLLNIAPGDVVLNLWTTPVLYLVIGGFLIAAAVRDCGLGQRIAYYYSSKFLSNYSSIIISTYVLGFLLSFLIPHPWPRSVLIMSIMQKIIRKADIGQSDAINIGLAVFAAACPTSAILLTGDTIINTVTVKMSGMQLSWLGWLWQMGIPAICASLLTLGLQLKLYKPTREIKIERDFFKSALAEMGPISRTEIKCLAWVSLAMILWTTDSLHHIHPGWIALFVSVGLCLPTVGGGLTNKSWADVPMSTLFFLTAALAIGTVGNYTGMNSWLAALLLPTQLPTNPFILAALITTICMAVHMAFVSLIAVMSIIIPTLLVLTTGSGLNPLAISLLVYMSLTLHYLLPFHHINILVGSGSADYSARNVLRLGIPLTIVTFIITIAVMIPWWEITGLL